jgi:spermidine synthase
MNKINNGWFSEVGQMWPGQALSLQVEEILHHEKSEFQDIMVFKSATYGNVLVLDGAIQLTERDEFAYQEMCAHIAMCAHPHPKKVVVIGGGDGGVLRELAKHDTVEEITICEIDKAVIEVAKKYIPGLAKGFDDPRVRVHIGDGVKFLEEQVGQFDIVIVDSSDPIGPAELLFEKPFYASMRRALREGGIAVTQAECLWLHLDMIKRLIDQSRELYKHAEYAYTTVPTYPSGQIGFCLCSLRDESPKEPVRTLDASAKDLKYYNEHIHRASFVLPEFARKVLQG